MKIKIVVIDIETPAWLRKTLSVVAPAAAILVSGMVLAQPKQWMTGDPLTATDLNAISVLSVNGVRYSVGPTHFCGVGPVQTTGHIVYNSKTGFAGAKAMCEASAGCGSSPTAHMCDATEIARSLSVGDTVIGGWYTTETGATDQSGHYVFDCYGWTSTVATDYGARFIGGLAGSGSCTSMNEVMCCD